MESTKFDQNININMTDNDIFNFSDNDNNIHDGNKESFVRIAIHHHHGLQDTRDDIIRYGYCFSINWNSVQCQQIKKKLQIMYH